MGRIKNFWPIVFIGIIVLIISVRNYIPGTWLIGWDNLNPEFNFPLNIQRSIFSVWQEYQGLGSIGGLAYASDLIRQIGLWILHIVAPSSLLRYIYTFAMLLLGPLGIYVLLKKIIFKEEEESLSQIVSFLGAVFYLLNLATVQIFFTPFESFIAFYGFFPWLIFSFISGIRSHDKKHLIVFSIINILAMTSFYVSTIFIIFLASLTLLILGYFIENKQISILKKSSKLLLFIFFVNAFWLLPFLYFTFTHINQPVESHMNWMSTEDIYLRNKQFGDLTNVMFLKGFAFDYVDKDASGDYSYLMRNWREHVDKAYVKFIGFTILSIIICGFLSAHKEKKPYRWPFTLLFIFSFLMLANDTLPFSFIVEFLRDKSSIFAQIFRVSFTKFSNLVLLSYTVFFAYGLSALISYLNKKIKKIDEFVFAITLFCLGLYISPIFKGELFYYKTRIKMPGEYLNLMGFWNGRTSNSRIAILPQFTYWGWNYYKWGYGGSGFLWYGIRNPTLDRAFDGYRNENENYYREISNALYSDNLPLFEALLEKYQVGWVLFDENIIGSVSTRALNFNRIQEIVGKSTKLNLVTYFGKLKVYHVNLSSTPKDFVFLTKDLPTIGSTYRWNNFDKAYLDYGNYISGSSTVRGVMASTSFQPATSEVSYRYDKAYEEYEDYISSQQKTDFATTKKSALQRTLVYLANSLIDWTVNLKLNITSPGSFVNRGVDLPGVEPGRFGLTVQSSEPARPTPELAYQGETNLVNHFSGKDFVFSAESLPAIGPTYRWNNFDKAYLDYGNYITEVKSVKRKAESETRISLFGSFGTGHCKECYDNPKEENNYNTQKESNIKSIIHNISDFAAFLVNNILNNQAASIPTTPNNTKDQSTLPALSNILAKRNNSSLLNIGFFGNGGIIKPIYAKDNTFDSNSSTPGEFLRQAQDKLATPRVSNGYDVFYPFRSLFTGRQQNELEFGIEDKGDYFSLTTKIPKELAGYKLIIPQFEEKEVIEIDENDLDKKTVKTPEIYLDGEFIQIPPPQGSPSATPGVSSSPSATSPVVSLTLSYIREGNLEVRVPKIKGYYSFDASPVLMDLEPKTCDQFNRGIYKHEFVSILTTGEDLLRLTSIGSSNCLDFDLPHLSQDIGYLVTLQNRNIEGKSLLFSVINKNSQRADIETYLPKNSPGRSNFVTPSRWPNGLLEGGIEKSYFIIPPMEQYGLGYTLHLDNISIGRVKTVNDLGKITVNQIPYRFLSGLKIIKGDTLRTQGVTLQGIRVDHPNPSLYRVIIDSSTIGEVPPTSAKLWRATPEVSLSPSKNVTLVLSQSYDDGWKAYNIGTTNNESRIKKFLINLFPFWFGEELKDHVLVNNWENGWHLQPTTHNPQPTTIIIVYLPQYLEYIGFILLSAAFLIVIFYPNSPILNPRDGKN